jgi:hypothetical protein
MRSSAPTGASYPIDEPDPMQLRRSEVLGELIHENRLAA